MEASMSNQSLNRNNRNQLLIASYLFSHHQEGEDNLYLQKLKQATWVPHLFRISVSQNEYNNEKRQRITVRAVAPVDFAAESRFLLEEISKMRSS